MCSMQRRPPGQLQRLPNLQANPTTAIIIKKTSINEDFLQAAAINIKLNHVPITIVASYCPPKHKITQTQFENFFNDLNQYFIIGGDLNAKHQSWGCHATNPKRQALLKAVNNKQLSILTLPNPSYWPSSPRKRPDILDISIVKIPPNLSDSVKNLLDPCSDHSLILLCIDASPHLKPSNPSLINEIMNWEQFRDIINQKIKLNIRLKFPNDIDDAVLNLTQIIQSAAWNSTTQPNKNNNHNHLSIPAHVREPIIQKRCARARWQRSKLPSDKSNYNKLTSSLKRILQQLRNESYNNWISSLTTKDNFLWKATRNCLKQKPTQTTLKKHDGTWCKSNKENAELFCSYLSEVFKPHEPISNSTFTESIENSLTSALPLYLAPKSFSPAEVLHFINTFPLKKTPGIDLITAEVARQLPKTALIHLTHILNSILRLSYFPIQWKISLIILIRPISLLPFFAKLCEKMILKRISKIINDNQIIPHTQFGFQNKHSTIHQIHRLTDSIAYSLENKSYCSAILLDVAQAFDRVWHPGLPHKLKKILPPSYYLFFKSYLEDRFFATKVGSELSNLAPILAGVPQGAISSPILFNIYTADQPTTSHTSVADFADDKVIYTSEKNPHLARQHLQNHLNLLAAGIPNGK
ncbi:hypothetical protein QTP88_012684 [Uroleucon formosanum]